MFISQLRAAALVLFALLLTPVMASANDVSLTGQVTYRERMALPDGASLTVTLVALGTGKPIASAGANVADQGQVPLSFVLNVRSSVLDAGGSYGLVAQISAGGRVLFRNREAVVVDPAAPAAVEIVTHYAPGPMPAPANDDLPPVPTNALLDSDWTVTSIGGDPVLPGSMPTLAIAADLSTGGHGGCNSFFAEARFENGGLAFGPVAGTRMACAPEIMTQESRFFAALAATAGYELSGNALQLRDAAGVTLIGLVRAP